MFICIHIYARLQIFIQLSPTMTKLCQIKCDHPACVSADDGHFEHTIFRLYHCAQHCNLYMTVSKIVDINIEKKVVTTSHSSVHTLYVTHY